jgi:hypothetical protein
VFRELVSVVRRSNTDLLGVFKGVGDPGRDHQTLNQRLRSLI